MNIACVQRTKWKKDKIKEFGRGIKCCTFGKTSGRNGVAAILYESIKTKMMEVSDRIITIRLVLDASIVCMHHCVCFTSRMRRGREMDMDDGHARGTRKGENHNWR